MSYFSFFSPLLRWNLESLDCRSTTGDVFFYSSRHLVITGGHHHSPNSKATESSRYLFLRITSVRQMRKYFNELFIFRPNKFFRLGVERIIFRDIQLEMIKKIANAYRKHFHVLIRRLQILLVATDMSSHFESVVRAKYFPQSSYCQSSFFKKTFVLCLTKILFYFF